MLVPLGAPTVPPILSLHPGTVRSPACRAALTMGSPAFHRLARTVGGPEAIVAGWYGHLGQVHARPRRSRQCARQVDNAVHTRSIIAPFLMLPVMAITSACPGSRRR
jgi:hypothetical protein